MDEAVLLNAPNRLAKLLPAATARSDTLRVIDFPAPLTLSASTLDQKAVCIRG